MSPVQAGVVTVGAVAYDPKVVPIWESMREYFREAGVPTDYVLFSNYEAQVEALFGRRVDIAWNTNVAYLRCEQRAGGACQVLGMRNTDIGFTTRLVGRGPRLAGLAELKGKRLALGSADSAQAAILPLHWLREAGLDPDTDVEIQRFNLDVGKHGDTGTSELEVLRALHDGTADVGAVGDPTWIRELEAGHVNSSLVTSLWTSPPYCHCNFTALPDYDQELGRSWSAALLALSYNDPRWRRLMDQEGLTEWVPGRKAGYEALAAALGHRG
jgi:phosphonate transport system substrate-binding protein